MAHSKKINSNTALVAAHDGHCRACLLPLGQDKGKRPVVGYCSYCQKNGRLCCGHDIKAFKKIVYPAMRAKGIGFFKARFFIFMINFAPHWRDAKTVLAGSHKKVGRKRS